MHMKSFVLAADGKLIRNCALPALLISLAAYGTATMLTAAIATTQPSLNLRLAAATSTANQAGAYAVSTRMSDELIRTGSITPQNPKPATSCAK